MSGGCGKKFLFITIKVLCILLMLSFTFLFSWTDISTAIGSFSPIIEHSQSNRWASQNPDQKSDASRQPVDSIVVPLSHEAVHSTDNISHIEGFKQNNALENTTGSIDIIENAEDEDIENAEKIQQINNIQDATNTNGELDSIQEENNTDGTQEENDTGYITDIDIAAYQLELNNIVYNIDTEKEDKVAYLTFDDGPTPSITPAILDILSKEGVKATFFVIGTNAECYPDLIRRIYQEGHGIGNHSYSHVFKQIYANTDNYINELDNTKQILQSILGEDKSFILTRFPGGSYGTRLAPFREAVNKAGYLYVDWNCVNGDAESVKTQPAAKLIQKFKDTMGGKSSLVVLMHDAPNKYTTVQALPKIIRYLKSKNYRFELLPWSR
ncbi:MAG: polysaccharide deacetylase [Clostridiales bacterium]|nr:polysaccharide deacetylase [Clostridiales bacterium]